MVHKWNMEARFSIILLFVLILAGCAASVSPMPTATLEATPTVINTPEEGERPVDDIISGTYQLKREGGGGCVMKVIYHAASAPFREVSIELVCNRGAPSYNSGYEFRRVLTADKLAVISPSPKCSLVFEFFNAGVKVTQIGEPFDCDFGHAVFVNGKYTLISTETPELGCMRQDNPCNLPYTYP